MEGTITKYSIVERELNGLMLLIGVNGTIETLRKIKQQVLTSQDKSFKLKIKEKDVRVVSVLMEIISKEFNIFDSQDIIITNKRGNILKAKQIAYLILNQKLGLTYKEIGNLVFKEVSEGAICRNISRFHKDRQTDKTLDEKYKKIESQFREKVRY